MRFGSVQERFVFYQDFKRSIVDNVPRILMHKSTCFHECKSCSTLIIYVYIYSFFVDARGVCSTFSFEIMRFSCGGKKETKRT